MILVVGATGLLGAEICRLVTQRGNPLRALVRGTSNPDRVAHLKSIGAEQVRGDLKEQGSLDAACRGVSAVISTASSTMSRQEGDSIESVDRQGQLHLIEAAAAAGVQQLILISFLGFDAANAKAQVYGAGQNQISWISFQDVARFAVTALKSPRAKNAVIQLGGPEPLSPLEVVHLAEQVTRKRFDV